MISREEIQNLATLSRLKLSEEEMTNLEKEFGAILDYVGQIQNAVTGEAERPAVSNVMREDVTGKIVGGTPESILAQAPRREGDYIVVRKILNKDE